MVLSFQYILILYSLLSPAVCANAGDNYFGAYIFIFPFDFVRNLRVSQPQVSIITNGITVSAVNVVVFFEIGIIPAGATKALNNGHQTDLYEGLESAIHGVERSVGAAALNACMQPLGTRMIARFAQLPIDKLALGGYSESVSATDVAGSSAFSPPILMYSNY
jgi:hypothetical protein